jgi:GT2 family glycosyltransferase
VPDFYNDHNTGFAAAQNQAIRLSRGEWILTLNPDVLLLPNFIAQLVEAGYLHPRIGSVCGKLLTISATFDLPDRPRVDSTWHLLHPDAPPPRPGQSGDRQRRVLQL